MFWMTFEALFISKSIVYLLNDVAGKKMWQVKIPFPPTFFFSHKVKALGRFGPRDRVLIFHAADCCCTTRPLVNARELVSDK